MTAFLRILAPVLTFLALSACRHSTPIPPPPPPPPSPVNVILTWDYPAVTISNFNVYADGTLCQAVDSQARQATCHVLPGTHTYCVEAVGFPTTLVSTPVCLTATIPASPIPIQIHVGTVPAFPFPALPSRSTLIHITSDFADLYDRTGLVINTGYLPSLMTTPGEEGRVQDWLDRLHAAGDTHIVVQGWSGFGGYPGYPAPWHDLRDRLADFKAVLIRLIRDEHLTPIVFLGSDGQTGGSGGRTGQQWFVANIASIIQQLRALPGPDIVDYCLWSPGWELSISLPGFSNGNAGDHSPDQIQEEFAALRRALGPNAQIASHLGAYLHLGGGASDWLKPGLREVDAVLLEFAGSDATNITNHEGRFLGSAQCADEAVALYMLGPAITFTPSPPCQTQAPWYMGVPAGRGPRAIVAFETVAYPASHPSPGQLPNVFCGPACQHTFHLYLYSLGFRLFGNGQPN